MNELYLDKRLFEANWEFTDLMFTFSGEISLYIKNLVGKLANEIMRS